MVVIDDHEVLRAGTRQVLETTDDIVVVGEADTWDAALELIEEHGPDVALVDIQLSGSQRHRPRSSALDRSSRRPGW